jgi:hypothetical protein
MVCFHTEFHVFTSSGSWLIDRVIIDSVWIHNRIYWTLKHTTHDDFTNRLNKQISGLIHGLHSSARYRFPTADAPLPLGSRTVLGLRYCNSQLTRCLEVEVTLRPTVSRPVCLGVRRPSGTRDQFSFLLEIPFRYLHVCYFLAPSLTRGRVCNLDFSSLQ